jgi:hypothetical protein
MPGKKNLSILLLFFWRKFICPLCIKLGLIKKFVKGLDKTGRGFEYSRNNVPNMSVTKIKVGLFIEFQIREMMQDE